MTINHFPQASAYQNGVRLSDYNDAPINPKGQPSWCSSDPCQPGMSVMLRPDLVFAYLEDPPTYIRDNGFGADWYWPVAGFNGNGNQMSDALRATFDAARTSGASISEAAGATRTDDAFSGNVALLKNNEVLAKDTILSGAFDTALGLPVNYTHRRELAVRAGLGSADVTALGNLPKPLLFNRTLFDALSKRPILLNETTLIRAFTAKPTQPTAPVLPPVLPPTTVVATTSTKIVEVVIAGIFGVGAILGVLWGVKKL